MHTRVFAFEATNQIICVAWGIRHGLNWKRRRGGERWKVAITHPTRVIGAWWLLNVAWLLWSSLNHVRVGLGVGHSHNHPSCLLTLKTWPGTRRSRRRRRSHRRLSIALASDLNILMDQLAHVLVITHNTFCPFVRLSVYSSVPPSLCPSVHLSLCTRPRRRFDVWRERTFDGRSVRSKQALSLFQFAWSFTLSVSMLANLEGIWMIGGGFCSPLLIHLLLLLLLRRKFFALYSRHALIYWQLIWLKCHNS